MDPIERLRALRDDSRWVPGEVELSAAPRPARLWRHWWPRITVAAIACAALAGLVIATLVGVGHTTDFAPGPASTDSSTPVVSPSASPSPTPTELPVPPVATCDADQLQASAEPQGEATELIIFQVTITNTSSSGCEITTPPIVHWANTSAPMPTSPIGPAALQTKIPQHAVILWPGAAAYMSVSRQSPESSDTTAECQPALVNAFVLTLGGSEGAPQVLAAPISDPLGTMGRGPGPWRFGCTSTANNFLRSDPVSLSPADPFTR